MGKPNTQQPGPMALEVDGQLMDPKEAMTHLNRINAADEMRDRFKAALAERGTELTTLIQNATEDLPSQNSFTETEKQPGFRRILDKLKLKRIIIENNKGKRTFFGHKDIKGADELANVVNTEYERHLPEIDALIQNATEDLPLQKSFVKANQKPGFNAIIERLKLEGLLFERNIKGKRTFSGHKGIKGAPELAEVVNTEYARISELAKTHHEKKNQRAETHKVLLDETYIALTDEKNPITRLIPLKGEDTPALLPIMRELNNKGLVDAEVKNKCVVKFTSKIRNPEVDKVVKAANEVLTRITTKMDDQRAQREAEQKSRHELFETFASNESAFTVKYPSGDEFAYTMDIEPIPGTNIVTMKVTGLAVKNGSADISIGKEYAYNIEDYNPVGEKRKKIDGTPTHVLNSAKMQLDDADKGEKDEVSTDTAVGQ